MARKVWFQLVDAATRGPFVDHKVSSVPCDGINDIEDLRNKIHAKAAYDKENGQPLKASASVDDLGKDDDCALIVEVPQQHLVPRTLASVAELIAIPSTTVLNEPDKYAEECISLTEWGVDAVHEIPLIWRFMSSLGGCTNSGKIFWRMEDKQVVSLMVDGWFRESTRDRINVHANKKIILMGSPGIGKSTLLCVMAFH
ncbi:hypothetical protein JG688_00016799, partial [Phytophthora aleatoria]